MTRATPDTEELIARARQGDDMARQRLLARHRDRLRRMFAVRMDPRLAARIDPSDLVQETLADAAAKLDAYLHERSLPFYAWVRQLAWDHLVQAHRRHVRARRRSVSREEQWAGPADASSAALAERLMARNSSPSQRLLREEERLLLLAALARLSGSDREILVMKYLEQLSTAEVATILDLTEAAVKKRHTRALERLRAQWDEERSEGRP
jgi:RNA polymerase sigma-70 factor (ECF subfamily)